MLKFVIAVIAALIAFAAGADDDDDPRPFSAVLNAESQIDATLARAAEANKGVLLVFGQDGY